MTELFTATQEKPCSSELVKRSGDFAKALYQIQIEVLSYNYKLVKEDRFIVDKY
jgi:hypothetical protein